MSVDLDAPIYESEVALLVAMGFLKPHPLDIPDRYEATDKLSCLMDSIMRLPQPIWSMPC